jgi:hypothetical protein
VGKGKPDLGGWLGLAILLLVILIVMLLARYRPGFFQGFAPVF